MDIVSVNGAKVNTQSIVRPAGGTLLTCPGRPIDLEKGQRAEKAVCDALGLSYVSYLAAKKQERKNRLQYTKENGAKAPENEVTAYDGASLLEFKPERVSVARAAKTGGEPRGIIVDFSRASAMRLMKELNRIHKVKLVRGLFVTLTYPKDYERWSVAETKHHLEAWYKRVKRLYPDAALVWKLEPQERGAPHYHLVVLGVDFIPNEWVSRSWYEVVGSGDPDHLKAGTEIEHVKSYKGAVSYLGKYLAKNKNKLTDEAPGRFWGAMGPIDKYYGEKVVFPMSGPAAVEMFRILDKRRLAVARRPVEKKYTDRFRRWQITKARRRRAGYKQSRWFVCDVNQMLRYFLEGGCNGKEAESRE